MAGGSPAAVVRVDPLTGAQTIVSDATTGSGPSFGSGGLTGIVVEPTGDIVIIDPEQDTVVLVDPFTGNRTVISLQRRDRQWPSRAPKEYCHQCHWDPCLRWAWVLFQVDPHTGMRRVVANLSGVFSDMAVEATGTVIG